ncbi:MAG: SIS domain-containing protein, partial [Candidatus Aminicenantes bacterium]|nr:SIS domain-containing protein [Candidatus Aminicenantes bacterium]
DVFSRQVEALGTRGDVVLGITTSGNSANVIKAIQKAKEKCLMTAVLTGDGGGKIGAMADCCLNVPSKHTPLIQEVHLFLLHILAEEIERRTGLAET